MAIYQDFRIRNSDTDLWKMKYKSLCLMLRKISDMQENYFSKVKKKMDESAIIEHFFKFKYLSRTNLTLKICNIHSKCFKICNSKNVSFFIL